MSALAPLVGAKRTSPANPPLAGTMMGPAPSSAGRAGGLGAVGATIWIVARILYFPIYMMGVIYVRTALWSASVIGLLMMLVRLAWS